MTKKQIAYKSIFVSVVTLGLPTMLEQVMSVLMSYVDTAMVGHLGAEATAAVSMSTSPSWLLMSLGNAYGVAAMTIIAQSIGMGDFKKVKKVAWHVLGFAIVFGIILETVALLVSPHIAGWMGIEEDVKANATAYFFWINVPLVLKTISVILNASIRATKDTKSPMVIGIGANALNVILNYVLIYMIGLGVRGAAYASCISASIAAVCSLTVFLRNPYFKRGEAGSFGKKIITDIIRLGFPIMITSLASCMGYVTFAGMVSHMGTVVFAAHSIAIGAEELFYTGGYGFKAATNTLVGESFGQQNYEKYHAICVSALVATFIAMTVSGVLLFVFARPLMGFFTTNPDVIDLGTSVLKLVAFNEPFFGLYIVGEGIYFGLGQTRYPLAVNFSGMWAVRILVTFIVINIFGGGLIAVWGCMIADNIFKAIMYMIPLRKQWGRGKL